MYRMKALLTALSVALVLLVQPAIAGGQDFLLVNTTGVDIYQVYVSPTGEADWQEDILGEEVLLDGEEISVTFDRSEEAELWDIRVEDDEGNALEFTGINLFEVSQVTLRKDGKAVLK